MVTSRSPRGHHPDDIPEGFRLFAERREGQKRFPAEGLRSRGGPPHAQPPPPRPPPSAAGAEGRAAVFFRSISSMADACAHPGPIVFSPAAGGRSIICPPALPEATAARAKIAHD